MSGRLIDSMGPIPHDRRPLSQWEQTPYTHQLPPVEAMVAGEPHGPRAAYDYPSQYRPSPPSHPHAPYEPLTAAASGYPQMELPSPPAQEHDPYHYDLYKGYPPPRQAGPVPVPVPVSPPDQLHQELPPIPSTYERYPPPNKDRPLVRSRLAQQSERNGHTYYSTAIAPREKKLSQSGDPQHLGSGSGSGSGNGSGTSISTTSRGHHHNRSGTMSPAPANPPRQQIAVPGRSAGIPNLLGPAKTQMISQMNFTLSMRQQPRAARACGSGERDRRNIDPPPIVQLHVSAPGMTDEEARLYLRYEGYVMNCWIYDESGVKDMSAMPSEYRYQRRLTGSLVATPFHGRDELGNEGCFFPFSDLSVRTLGRYRIKFNLIMLDAKRAGTSTHFPILAETFSGMFDVYTAKEFPGINESSRLVRCLREQGCIISIKKGNDKKKKSKAVGYAEEVEDEIEDDPYD